MTILDYLEGRCELDALSDAQKCAVCAAIEGEWVYETRHNWLMCGQLRTLTNYLSDGTACLRLVERLKISLDYTPNLNGVSEWMALIPYKNAEIDHVSEFAPTVPPAIVAAVCALARAQFPYKVSKPV